MTKTSGLRQTKCTDKMYRQFHARGYSKDTLDRALYKLNSAPSDTQNNKKKKKDHYVICYTPLSNLIENIIRKHWDVLQIKHVQSFLEIRHTLHTPGPEI